MLIALSVANSLRKSCHHPHSDEDLSRGVGRDGKPHKIPFLILLKRRTGVSDLSDKELRRGIAYFTTFVSMFSVTTVAPFFPTYARDQYNASESLVGITFACNPLAQVTSAAAWAVVTSKLGREDSLLIGLSIISLGSLIFSVGDSMAVFMIGRFLQGVGTQGTNSAGVAIILETSDDVQRDMGFQELIVGFAYMAGPFVGGWMYETFGFSLALLPTFLLSTFLAIASSYLMHSTGSPRFTPPHAMCEAQGSFQDDVGSSGGTGRQKNSPEAWLVLKNTTVASVCVAIMAHAGAQGFTDTTLGRHIQLSKGADTSVAGAAFMISPAVYAFSCLYVGRCNLMSLRTQVFLGLVLCSAGCLLLAPPDFLHLTHGHAPALAVAENSTSSSSTVGVPITRSGDWMLDVLALAITGMGSGLVLVPSVPLMVACTRSVSGGADLTDAVSSIYSSSWSMGELLGPPLGGLMLERLPKSRELNCVEEEGIDCEWAFQPSMQFFALLMMLASLLHAPVYFTSAKREESRQGGQEPSHDWIVSPIALPKLTSIRALGNGCPNSLA